MFSEEKVFFHLRLFFSVVPVHSACIWKGWELPRAGLSVPGGTGFPVETLVGRVLRRFYAPPPRRCEYKSVSLYFSL